MQKPVTIDFETEAIEPRPAYPPKPVGASVWVPGSQPRYYAWGHPAHNNCSRDEALRALKRHWYGKRDLLFHNAKFDVDVAETHLGLAMPDWRRIHDTEFLAFLLYPYARQLSLKPLAEAHLDMPPDEQAELRDWIIEMVPEARRRKTRWGAYIALAPGSLVGKYAIGDAVRTRRLFDKWLPEVAQLGMSHAYDIERQLVPILIKAERRGVPVDIDRLRRDHEEWQRRRIFLDTWLCERLGIKVPKDWYDKGKFKSPINQRTVFANALERVGAVEEWKLTEKAGRGGEDRSTAMDALDEVMNETRVGKKLYPILKFRSVLSYIINYSAAWVRNADESGRLYLQWNQVRQENERGKGLIGARTGRLSSTPNWQNVYKKPPYVFYGTKTELKVHARSMGTRPAELAAILMPNPLKYCGDLPALRDYVRAPRGYTLQQRDYSQQELRILAHFEGGDLLDAYLDNPLLDQHSHAQVMINGRLNSNFERKPIKNVGFGIIYGLGIGGLARNMGTDTKTARTLRDAYREIFPGLKKLEKESRVAADEGTPIVTLAGRRYHVEEPKFLGGRLRTFEYKLINYRIQGSAGDCTKEALINLDAMLEDSRFCLTVHDEFINECPRGAEKKEMELFREALLDVSVGVPMLSDGKQGRVWARMKSTKDPARWWERTNHVEPWSFNDEH